jgi:hypothetical protein
MRMLALAILAIGTTSLAGPAQAQTFDPRYPVCMHVVGAIIYDECRFSTLAQCAQSASGRAAQCNMNPYYAGAGVPAGRPNRRHSRVY